MTKRERLMTALATGHAADEACRQELASGASIRLSGATVSVSNLASVYARRVDHPRSLGIRLSGDDVVRRLTESGQAEVRIAGVHGADNFAIFLAPDTDQVVASIGVDGSVANTDYWA
jgi:hypothetical protein